MAISRDDYEYLRGFLLQESAIALDDGKEYLAESRLMPIASREGVGSVAELLRKIRLDPAHRLRTKIVEAMTTNETSFFRDVHPFEEIRDVLIPDLIERRAARKTLRIWCAACSTGQEPYSVAMLLRDHFPELMTWKVEILASDLSTEILERAREGRFTQLEVNRGVPVAFLLRFFRRDGLHWQLDEGIRRMVDFRPINLVQPWPPVAPMDLVLMRNVLIYFDAKSKKQVLAKVAVVMAPDGFLMLGGSESALFIDDRFERVVREGCSAHRLKRRG
jgi:chemotaxis protein methyltransferase CheR